MRTRARCSMSATAAAARTRAGPSRTTTADRAVDAGWQTALALVEATGRPVDPTAGTRLAVRRPLPDVTHLLGEGAHHPYVVVHPGASVPSRAASPLRSRAFAAGLVEDGWKVLITGSPGERDLTSTVCPAGAIDLGGRTGVWPARRRPRREPPAAVVGNTGPAHLAAAVGSAGGLALRRRVVPAEPAGAPWKA